MRIGGIAVVGAAFVGSCAAAEMPRTSDGKPDLNGSWNLPYTPNMAKDIGELPFTAEGKAAYASQHEIRSHRILPVPGRAAHQQFAVSHADDGSAGIGGVLVRVHDHVPRRAFGSAGALEESGAHVHGRIDRQMGRRRAGDRYSGIQRSNLAGYGGASAQRRAARNGAISVDRYRTTLRTT